MGDMPRMTPLFQKIPTCFFPGGSRSKDSVASTRTIYLESSGLKRVSL